MTTKTCYIAGPMTGIHEFNFPAFDAARDALTADGWEVISPADMDRDNGFDERGKTGHEMLADAQRQQFARNDIDAIMRSDAVFLLDGWEHSTGARNEVSVANWLGVAVLRFDDRSPVAPQSAWSSKAPNERAKLLTDAEALVNGDRNVQYGDPRADFQRTAAMWSAYLGTEVAPHDVAALMAMLKLSRIRWSPAKYDSWADLAGYAACGWDCASALEPQ